MQHTSIEYVRFKKDSNIISTVSTFFRNSKVSTELQEKIAEVGQCWYVHYGNIFDYDLGISYCLSDILPYVNIDIYQDDIWAMEITVNEITLFDEHYTIIDRYSGYYKYYLDSFSN